MSTSDASGVTPSTDRYPLSALFSPTLRHTGTLPLADDADGEAGEGEETEEGAARDVLTPLLCDAACAVGIDDAEEDSIERRTGIGMTP
jgi:hypothetical protein